MTGALAIVGSIPSPSFNTIGPFTLYGLMIGLGIIAATLLARPRLEARSIHPDTVMEMVVWVVPGGIVGARLYHVITDGKSITEWHEIWEGGLGIPGAIAGGAIAGLLFFRNRGLPRAKMLDAVVPGLPLAQAIGRWGNWWNQELYGKPTDLPWGLEIDRPVAGYTEFETFHPTFLYESLWNLALCGFLLWVDRTKMLKVGKLIWVYTGVYAIGRLWIETLRIDHATEILGARINLWMMGIVLLVSIFMLRDARRDGAEPGVEAADVAGVDADQTVLAKAAPRPRPQQAASAAPRDHL